MQQSLKKIKILENRVESLSKVKKNADAIVKAKKLFHLSTSFVSILFQIYNIIQPLFRL